LIDNFLYPQLCFNVSLGQAEIFKVAITTLIDVVVTRNAVVFKKIIYLVDLISISTIPHQKKYDERNADSQRKLFTG
jgi:hypothetical protein